jgi:hypothetical protein
MTKSLLIMVLVIGPSCLLAQSNRIQSDSSLWKEIEEMDRPTSLDSSLLSSKELAGGWRIFQDTLLGVRFRYNKDFESPTDAYSNHPTTSDLNKWKTFLNDRFPLSFKYPPELEVRIQYGDLREISPCDSSLEILLGFRYPDSSEDTVVEQFASLMTVYFTSSSFDSIAENEDFVRNSDSGWQISGVGGPSEAAMIHLDSDCHGLRGHSFTMIYWQTPMHGAVVDVQRSVLVFERRPECSIVFTFYEGPTDEPLDEPPFDLAEATFYKIVATVKIR